MSGRFTSEQLKKIAMGTMFLDHAAATIIFGSGLNEMSLLLENIGIAMRLIGRMAFPLYAFLLVQGFLWTRDWSRYVMRMAVFALVSEVPFDLMLTGEIWYSNAQNTIVTLLCGLICMRMLEALEKKFGLAALPVEGGGGHKSETSGIDSLGSGGVNVSATGHNASAAGHNVSAAGKRKCDKKREVKKVECEIEGKWIGIALAIWVTAAAMLAAELLRGDYGAFGVLVIVALYMFRHRPMEQVAAGCLALVLIYGFGLEVVFAWIAIFVISRYNGERGRKLGLMPYVFYPAHLLAVWLAGTLVSGM